MINELYLKKAATIRKDYLKLISDIEKYENLAHGLANSIQTRTNELEKLLENLNSGKLRGTDSAKDELHKIMVSAEQDINDVDKSIKDVEKKMDKLRADEMDLYRTIKQTYIELNDDQIKSEIDDYLKKLNLS